MSTTRSINIVNGRNRYRGRGSQASFEVKTKGTQSSSPTPTPSEETYPTPKSYKRSSDTSNSDIGMAKFTELLEKVKEYANIPDSELPHPIRQISTSIIHIVNLNKEEDRPALLRHAQKVLSFEKLENITPFSLAAHLFGCSVNACPGIDLGCNILCAASVGTDPNSTGWAPCDDTVLSYNENGFTTATIGTTNTDRALVFVGENFRGIHPTHAKALIEDRKIKTIRVVHFDQASSTCTQASPSFLPVEKFILQNRRTNQLNPIIPTTGSGLNTGTLLLVGLAFLVLFGISIWYIRKRATNKGMGETVSKLMSISSEEAELPSKFMQVSSGITPRFPFRSMTSQ